MGILQTITQWLKAQPRQCTLAWATTSCAQAVHGCLYGKPDVDVLLVDMALGAMSGPNLCKTIRMHSPRPAVLGMTAFDPELFRDDLIVAGAQGIMDKQSIIPGLMPWLATLAEGGSIQPETFHDAPTAHRILREATEGRPSGTTNSAHASGRCLRCMREGRRRKR